MKKSFLLSLCFLIFTTLVKTQDVVVGSIVYTTYDYGPSDNLIVGYLNSTTSVVIDSFTAKDMTDLLIKAGVDKNKIIYTDARSSSGDDIVEIWFAYEGKLNTTNGQGKFWISNPHHSAYYNAVNNYLAVRQSTKLDIEKMKPVVSKIALNYNIRSFMVKPWSAADIPLLVIARGTQNGELADMRWIRNSYRLVPYFKELNWRNIWYQDENGNPKNVMRPATGW